MIKVFTAIAGNAGLVCAPAAGVDGLYLGSTCHE